MSFRTIPILLLLAVSPALAAPNKSVPSKAAPAKPAAKASVLAKPKAEPPVTVESLLAGSQAASGRGETELALRLAQAAIVADPARPGSYVVLGDIYAGSGQPDYARSFYESALGIDPSEPNALKALTALDHGSTVNAAR
jgi:tetratricopeptide (TPR) repeat protein